MLYSSGEFDWNGVPFLVRFEMIDIDSNFVWSTNGREKQIEWSRKQHKRYLRGDLSSFLFLDFFDDELLDVDRDEVRSLFELEPFDTDDLDLEPALLPMPDLLDFDDDLLGERKFLCLWTSLSGWSPILLLLLTCGLFVVSV